MKVVNGSCAIGRGSFDGDLVLAFSSVNGVTSIESDELVPISATSNKSVYSSTSIDVIVAFTTVDRIITTSSIDLVIANTSVDRIITRT